MGQEIACDARVDGAEARGTALLETDEVIFRRARGGAGARVRVPFASIRAMRAKGGWLAIEHAGGELSLGIGDAVAAKWIERIRKPKSAVDKLGVASGKRVALVAMEDDGLARDLEARGAIVSSGAPRAAVDVVIFGAHAEGDLARVASLAKKLAPDGMLWIVRPKGKDGVPEAAVMRAGKDAGLVDVKVARHSETHTAEKFVIPVARRGASR